jgi:hypothetical protein
MAAPVWWVLGALALVLAAALCWLLLARNSAGSWRELREHWRGVRALRRQRGVPIEQVAADLRRLRRVIANDGNRSAAHQLGDRMAYDTVLVQACDMMGIGHELDTQIGGLDRDIERLRVEAELERAGVVISTWRYGQAA